MTFVFNLIIVALAALIAYWWANQGVFSALLHTVCVIAAGAIAFALWEPITVNFLLRGSRADDYMWGVSLIVIFVLALFLLRLACDKLAPANVNFPQWANYTFGGLIGCVAGVLTMGMFVIGIGFIQSSTELMGFIGKARAQSGKVERINTMYPPIHEWTGQFYSFLSNGAFYPIVSPTPMRKLYPDIATQAVSLQRDSFNDGRGKTSLAPDAAGVSGFFVCKDFSPWQYGVLVDFNRAAFDMPEATLTISSAQVRLIGDTTGWKNPGIAYPFKWGQRTETGNLQFLYDDSSHYAQNIPGQEKALILFAFAGDKLGERTPKYVQIKGTRYRLPPATELTEAQWNALFIELKDPKAQPVQIDASAPKIANADLTVDNGIQPVSVSSNEVAPMRHKDGYLTAGTGTFKKGGFSASRVLRIRGVYEPEGTKIVKLNISRKRSSVDVYGDIYDPAKEVDEKDRPYLVDDQNGRYTPVGYLWVRPDNVVITLDPVNGVATRKDLPPQPSAGTHDVYLLFAVTKGARIKAFMIGDTTIGVTDKVIE